MKRITILIGGQGHGLKVKPGQENSVGIMKYGCSYRPRTMLVSCEGQEVEVKAFVLIDMPALKGAELMLSAVERGFVCDE